VFESERKTAQFLFFTLVPPPLTRGLLAMFLPNW